MNSPTEDWIEKHLGVQEAKNRMDAVHIARNAMLPKNNGISICELGTIMRALDKKRKW